MKQPSNGITLVEIMIAMVIVAAIAIFSIPKVLTVSQNSNETKWKRSSRQAIAEVSAAYSLYRQNNRTVPITTKLTDLTPYLNYVKYDTTSIVDGTHCEGTLDCSSGGWACYHLKNGGLLLLKTGPSFNGTGKLNALNFKFDPDAKITGGAGHEGTSLNTYMYYSGRMKTRAQIDDNTTDSAGTYSSASCDPNWWNWD